MSLSTCTADLITSFLSRRTMNAVAGSELWRHSVAGGVRVEFACAEFAKGKRPWLASGGKLRLITLACK